MQKIFTLCVLSILCFSVKAQFKKGDKVLGAGLNFQKGTTEINSTSTPQTTKTTSFDLSAELGKAKKENRLSGFFFGVGYGISKNEASTPILNYEGNYLNANAGYFTRVYKPLGKNFFVFGEGRGSLSYYQENYSANITNPDNEWYGVYLGLYPGLAYKWNNRFLFELRFADFANVGYTQKEIKTENNKKNIQRNFSLGTSLGLGYLSNIGIGARWIMK